MFSNHLGKANWSQRQMISPSSILTSACSELTLFGLMQLLLTTSTASFSCFFSCCLLNTAVGGKNDLKKAGGIFWEILGTLRNYDGITAMATSKSNRFS